MITKRFLFVVEIFPCSPSSLLRLFNINQIILSMTWVLMITMMINLINTIIHSRSLRQLYPEHGSAMVWEYDQLLAKKPNRLECQLSFQLLFHFWSNELELIDRADAVFPAHQDSGWIWWSFWSASGHLNHHHHQHVVWISQLLHSVCLWNPNNNERDDIVGKLTRYWYTPEGLPTATATCSLAINDADQASSWISSLHHHCILIASSSSSSPSLFFVRRIVFSQIIKLPRPMAAWGDYYDLKSNSQMSTFTRVVDLVMIPPCCDDFGQGSARIS